MSHAPNQPRHRRRLLANRLHRELFLIFSVAAILPTVLTAVGLFYLIFNITAHQMAIPEAIAYNLIPAARRVLVILAVALPATIAVILVLAHRFSHRIVGPYDRIVRELGESLAGERTGPIVLRQADRFVPLVAMINRLLALLPPPENPGSTPGSDRTAPGQSRS